MSDSSSTILINGVGTDVISVTDRGVHYGDGVYETIPLKDGRLQYWDRHQQRMVVGCYRLKLPIPSIKKLESEIRKVCKGKKNGVVKIIITRGNGGRGYLSPTKTRATRIVACYPYPNHPEGYWSEGVKVRLCETPLGMNPVLAGIKHCNRLEQILARNEWQDEDIPEGVMLDGDQNVIEGTMTNIFVSRNGGLLTPAISHCGVEGVMREVVIDECKKLQIPLTVDTVSLEDLINADEVFLTNSVIGIWPVRQFDEQEYSIGSITQLLMESLLGLTIPVNDSNET